MVNLLLVRTVSKIKFRKVLDYWPYIILLIPIFIIVFPLTKPGAILHQDFPFGPNALSPSKALLTWIDFGSLNNFEFIARIPEISVGLALLTIGVTPDLISKLMVISVFYLASVSFYIFSTRLLNNKFSLQFDLKVAAIVGSLFYAYNIWSFDRILHWYLWLGYAVLPLFFISVILAFQNPRQWKYYLVVVLSWTVASSTPHMLVFFGLVFMGIASFFIIKRIHNKQSLIQPTTIAIMILSIFILVNAFWTYPFILSMESNEVDLTSIFEVVVTEETTKMFTELNNFTNVFRFIHKETGIPPITSPFYSTWSFVGFLLPAIAFLALYSKTFFRYALVFSLLAVLGIYLVMGSNEPFDLYSILLFKLPYVSNFAEMLFRDPDKWSFLIAISYSILLSISTFEFLRFAQRIRLRSIVRGLFVLMIVGSIAIQSHKAYGYFLVDRYSPAILPDDFDKLNKFIGSIDTDKVVYFPILLTNQRTHFHDVVWDNRSILIPDIYQWSSIKPSIGSDSIFTKNYYRYLSSIFTADKTDNINSLVTPFGTSYIIYHNDSTNPFDSHLLERLSSLNGIKKVIEVGIFHIFKIDNNVSSISIPHLNIAAIGGLDALTSLNRLDSFNSNETSLLFLDQNAENELDTATANSTNAIDGLILTGNANDLILSSIDDKYIIAPFDATNHHNVSKLWSKAGTLDPWHGPFHPYLQELGIENWDFDYGKGVVITDAKGAKLDIPFDIKSPNSSYYDIFLRYMENQNGGEIKIYLDNKLIRDINTEDEKSNSFVWENIVSNINLTQGRHTLTLENVVGFNAVNIFAALPVDETIRLTENAYSLANDTRNMYLLGGESDFYSLRSREPSNQTAQEGFNFGDFLEFFTTESERTAYLAPGSSVYTNLDIMKPSNYTIALHASTCVVCDHLKISIQDENGNFVVNNRNIAQRGNITENDDNTRDSALTWFYLDEIPLQEGHYSIEIHSDSETELDSVFLYSSDDVINNNDDRDSLDDIFNTSDTPAHIAEYTKVDPTKHIVKISNATKPFILSFAESFDPLWTASIADSNDTSRGNSSSIGDSNIVGSLTSNSLPLYSIINGFYIDRLGDYTITIEYAPQQWFVEGGMISIATLLTSIAAYFIFRKYRVAGHLLHSLKVKFGSL